MKKILYNLRSQSAHVRMMISIGLALVCTVGVAAFWIWTKGLDVQPVAKNDAPSPINALVQSIKTNVGSNHQTQTSLPVQVIDAGAQESVAHDETNPYQNPAQ